MTKTLTATKIKALLADGHPRMVGTGDIALARKHAQTLPKGATIVELGPWLGAISCAVAEFGDLHVVDNFIWTKDHARRVPDVVTPGASFRPLFEAIAAAMKVAPTLHESAFETFEWPGGAIDLLIIDSPKTTEALCSCLTPVAPALSRGATVLLKNGLNPKNHEMLEYVERLVSAGLFTYAPENAEMTSNILVLHAGDISETCREILEEKRHVSLEPGEADENSPLAMGPFMVSTITKLVEAGNWAGAYAELAKLPADTSNLHLWERLEPSIDTRRISAADLAVFSDLMAHHNNPMAHLQPTPDIARGAIAVLRAFWTTNAKKPWRAEAFRPDMLQKASDFGYMHWPAEIAASVADRDILDVGCGFGLHGLGFLALGAQSYTGIDPAQNPNRDRVKNLMTKSREAFGWTPNAIAEAIAPWSFRAVAAETFTSEQAFDLAVLRDVLGHVDDPGEVLANVAKHLRPGGRIIVHHKNFYCWNGHQQNPKTVAAIRPNDPEQANLMDWNHIGWDAPSDHYIANRLNRVRLDALTEAIERYFHIETLEDRLSKPKTGAGRLTDAVRKRYPDLTDRDFEVQSILCAATLRPQVFAK